MNYRRFSDVPEKKYLFYEAYQTLLQRRCPGVDKKGNIPTTKLAGNTNLRHLRLMSGLKASKELALINNNNGVQGGARLGAGRKKKAVTEKAKNGSPGGRKLEVLDIPEMEDVEMTKPQAEWLAAISV